VPPDAVAAAVPAFPPAPTASIESTLGERLSDRLNPLLSREVLQSLHGRTFLAALTLSLLAIVIVALSIASGADLQRPSGGDALVLSLQILAPVLLLLLPFRAFLSMRQEVSPGTVEHLLLSRLTPGRIVRGKLLAGCVEFGLFVSVFAPLLALTYLLRGVDVPTIALALAHAFAYALVATSFAVAMGALSRWPGGRALPLAILSLGLVYVTAGAVVGMSSFVLRLEELRDAGWDLEAIGNRFLPLAAATLLFLLVGGAALAHPYENRSTPFRAFALLGLLGGGAWMAYGRHLALAFYAASSGSWFPGPPEVGWWRYTAALCAPFWLFAVTEDEALPLRAKARVPRRPLFALLAAPFLPGGGRGMLWTTLLVAVAILGAPGSFDRSDNEAVLDAWAYAMLFAGLLRFGRHRWLPPGSRGTTLARLAAPVLLLLLSMLPFVVDLLIGDRRSSGNALHALSPVHLLRSGRHGDEFSGALAGAAVLCFLCQVPAMWLGIEEVMKASRARRRRAA